MKRWQIYADKFLATTAREQYLIIFTGIAVICFALYSILFDSALNELMITKEKSKQFLAENRTLQQTVETYQQALERDPNSALNLEIAQYTKKLEHVEGELLSLTSGFIDPMQMRLALLELLNVNAGVSLKSFELLGAEKMALPIVSTPEESHDATSKHIENDFVLYKHGVKLNLTGSYFQLKDYLAQLETLKWRFFWQEFNYNLSAYPEGEVEVILYSLSTKREFIGV